MNTIEVTYIGHSGFLVETEERYILFDYHEGTLPELNKGKPLIICVSHRHGDHFNPEIFGLAAVYLHTVYVLSYDIRLKPWNMAKWGISEEMKQRIISVKPDETCQVEGMDILPLKSTDEGVAFLIETEGIRIYHAGDLNWWYWKEESKQWNNSMTASFQREINKLTEMSIDVAFLPLDPRQEEDYWLGFEYMLKTARVKFAFPMHFWKEYSVIGRLSKEGHVSKYDTSVINIEREGQQWKINI